MDWLDLLAVQGTLKSLLQHHRSKASILWHSAFFTVQLSHPYRTTGETIIFTAHLPCIQFSSVHFSCSVVSDSLRTHEPQHARPPCPSPNPGIHSNPIELVMPSSHLILCCPLLLLPPIPPSIRVFSNESTNCSHEVAKVLEFQL